MELTTTDNKEVVVYKFKFYFIYYIGALSPLGGLRLFPLTYYFKVYVNFKPIILNLIQK